MAAMLDDRSAGYVRVVAERTATVLRGALVGTYLHGSAVLGGFVASRSDLDLLVVVTGALDVATKRRLARALTPEALPCPAAGGLELSVVTGAASLSPIPTPPFELHLAIGPAPADHRGDPALPDRGPALAAAGRAARVVDGRGHPGDPDLPLHFAVCRDHGRALAGPAPPRVFAPIPRRWLLWALVRELAWAEERPAGSPEYRVLNACRAWRFAEENLLCSKLDGGRWARPRLADPTVVDLALARQRAEPASPPDGAAVDAFVQRVLRRLRRALAESGQG